jgi:hypothetical protein
MLFMGKKNRHRHQKHVLKSFQDLGKKHGYAAGDTLSRLATTVKADAETLVLGAQKKIAQPFEAAQSFVAGATVKSEAVAKNAGGAIQRFSRFAQKLVPGRRRAVGGADTNKKLKEIARQMAAVRRTVMPKEPRSRLPLFAALATVALSCGGYYLYQNVSMPSFDVDFDVSDTLSNVGRRLDAAPGKDVRRDPASRRGTVQNPKFAGVPKPKIFIPKKQVPTRADKAFAKLPKSTKKAIWQQRLAKLKKSQAAPRLQRASFKSSTSKPTWHKSHGKTNRYHSRAAKKSRRG